MRILCIRKNLSESLSITARIISSATTLPILNNILLKTDQGRLKLSSTNLEIAINTWVGGKVEEEGELTVPAKLLNDYVNTLTTEKITLTTKTDTLFIEGEKIQTHIKGLPAEEFPLIPKVADEVYTKLDGKSLGKAIKEVSFAAAFSETQPEISGILFTFSQKNLILAATDRYRLAERKLFLELEATPPKQVIIPSRAVNEIGRMSGGETGMVEIFLSEGQICFKGSNIEIISRLVEGQYPDYQQIIPSSFTTTSEVSREEFTQALKAVSLFAAENHNLEIEAAPNTNEIIIRSQSAQVGDSEIRLNGKVHGEKNHVIFNFRYLLDCLNNLTDEKVHLKLISSSSPALIVPEGRQNYLYITMPIKV